MIHILLPRDISSVPTYKIRVHSVHSAFTVKKITFNHSAHKRVPNKIVQCTLNDNFLGFRILRKMF